MLKMNENIISMGSGTPVVLLHSAMSSKLQWYRLMHSMSKTYHVIALDFQGCGASSFPHKKEGSYSLSDEIEFMEPLINSYIPRDNPIHLVGHSYGGAVGLRYAYKGEKPILSLTLFEPVAFHVIPENEDVKKDILLQNNTVMDYINRDDYAGAAQYFVDFYNGEGAFARFPKDMQDLLIQSAKQLPNCVNALKYEPVSIEDYSQLTIPICIIAGSDSPIITRSVAEFLAAHLSNCQMKWVKGNHMAPVTHPQLVNPIIESFIQSKN